ncbi:MAG TPA: hypothetical protein VFT99_03875, partial [Roseiflexaceae bacterium]|nr:hypothetical protein [Roseiflexaceae bacterium]
GGGGGAGGSINALPGGSGGGAGGAGASVGVPGTGIAGQGFGGGQGNSNLSDNRQAAGGGGGASEVGQDATDAGLDVRGGDGGDGVDMSAIVGTDVGDSGWFGGGGGGAIRLGTGGGSIVFNRGDGGQGGGGSGGIGGVTGSTVGVHGTGGGGGGAGNSASASRGGDGTVIVMWGEVDLGGVQNDVYYAEISPPGATGEFGSQDANLSRRNHASVVYNGRVYWIAGRTVSLQTDTQYAVLNDDGTLGAWTDSGESLPGGITLEHHAAAVYDGHLYVLGGNQGGTTYGTIYYTTIQPDGDISPWSTASETMDLPLYGMTAEAHNGYLYIIGGRNGGNRYNTVWYAPIESNGDISTSPGLQAATSLPENRFEHTSVIYGDYLYVLGGDRQNDTQYTNTVYYAPINANGSLGAWDTGSTFTSA